MIRHPAVFLVPPPPSSPQVREKKETLAKGEKEGDGKERREGKVNRARAHEGFNKVH